MNMFKVDTGHNHLDQDNDPFVFHKQQVSSLPLLTVQQRPIKC